MANSKTHSAKTAAKKRPSKSAPKTGVAMAAVARHHHSGTKHSGEFDIDLTWPCDDISERLKALKKLLRIVIEAIDDCQQNQQTPIKGTGFAGNYHNITVCNGQRH